MIFSIFKRIALLFIICSSMNPLLGKGGQESSWPSITSEMKPGTRWWWLGSAVDQKNLTWNLEAYAGAGIGLVEITPIYGVQNNDANNIPFLSEQWMKMLEHTISETKRLGMQTDMNTGTGWPFGGPEVSVDDAASKLLLSEFSVEGETVFEKKIVPDDKKQVPVAKLQRIMAFSNKKTLNLTKFVDAEGNLKWKVPKGKWTLIAAFNGKTFQTVKRAAPGGEGYVMDHLSAPAAKRYFDRFSKSFETANVAYPNTFFNDSYEVYGSDWTEDFFEQFEKRRGYKLENYMPQFLSKTRTDETRRIVADYRETISDLLLENFTQQWTNWAHAHGSKTRNQAHGSPGNLIDLYASVDIPECEGFGLSYFNIKGLRTDSLTRKNDSDLSMLKYASSAAHIAGKQFISSETFTWLTEHFRTSLSQTKSDIDLMFVAGVNKMNFHGSTYSPREADWPGWKFYASIDMTPTNSIWRDAEGLMTYIARCQSFLQMGKPDNDFLVYLPVYDVWNEQSGRLLQFDIHSMEKRMPEFIHTVNSIYTNGYDVDYISDKFILSASCKNGEIITKSGASYKALILPAIQVMPEKTLQHIVELVKQGAKIAIIGKYPSDVPGFAKQKSRQKLFDKALKQIVLTTDFTSAKANKLKNGQVITGADYRKTLDALEVKREEMVTKFGLHAIRRSNETGYHYFISALHNKDSNGWISLSVPFTSAQIFNPITGENGKALVAEKEGKKKVFLQLKSGQSIVLKTYTNTDVDVNPWEYESEKPVSVIALNNPWKLHFVNSYPEVKDTLRLQTLKSWTETGLEILKINMGTGVYETTFTIDKIQKSTLYVMQLGDVRESARVYVNGQDAGIVWAAPFECRIGKFIKEGENKLRIEVTNLPANRIADYDRRNVNWRIFNEINFVDINYKKTGYANWKPMESGLCSPVKINLFVSK